MNLENIISRGWQKTADLYRGKEMFWHRSPQILLLRRSLQRIIPGYVHGIVLDAGAGASDYKYMFSGCRKYIAIDLHPKENLNCIADVISLPFKERKFDTILCSQVLEHLPNPSLALNEFYKALKPGGHLIVTVPHLSCYHDLPHDYYRFTAEGISFLLSQSGFQAIASQGCASILSFIGHILSRALLGMSAGQGIAGRIIFLINSLLSHIIALLDSFLLGFAKNIPLNIIAVCVKANTQGSSIVTY